MGSHFGQLISCADHNKRVGQSARLCYTALCGQACALGECPEKGILTRVRVFYVVANSPGGPDFIRNPCSLRNFDKQPQEGRHKPMFDKRRCWARCWDAAFQR